MGNWLIMHVAQGINNISKVLNCRFDRKAADFIEIVEKCATIQIFHNEINIVFLLKNSIKFNDVGMV